MDIANGISDDSNPPATDALAHVFPAVSVGESWNVALGYFFIAGMNGEERANLVNTCFSKLHAVNVRGISLTCDGPSAHFATIRALGGTWTTPSHTLITLRGQCTSSLMCVTC